MSKISLSTGLLLTNSNNHLLMLREPDGWGIPAGKIESEDFYLPTKAIHREFAEEVNAPFLGQLTLAGLVVILRPSQLSLGILFRSRQKLSSAEYKSVPQVLSLISQGMIRKPDYNLPALSAWITHSFIISLRQERG